MTPSRRGRLALVLTVAAVLRLANWIQIGDGPLPWLHRWTESDMNFYDRWARDIAAGDWLTDTRMRPYHSGHAAVARQAHALSGSLEPFDAVVGGRIWGSWLGEKTFYQDGLYAYVLAVVYRASGGRIGAAFFVQALLGLACVGLVFRIATRLFDPTVGLVAGSLAAMYGPLAHFETLLLKPVLILFTSLLAVLAFLWALDAPERARRFAVAGLASGLAFLAQSSALPFFAAALSLVAWQGRSEPRSATRAVVVATLGFTLALAPVVARNLAVGASPFVFNATGGWTFLNHNAEDYDPWVGDTVTHHAGAIMSRTHGRMLPTVRETIRTHASLAGWLRVVVGKLACFAHWYEMPNNASYYYFRMQAPALVWVTVSFSVVAPLAAFGLLGGLRGAPRTLLTLHVAWGLATIAIFYSIARLRLPVAVAMIPFAASGLVRLARLAASRRWTPFMAGLVVTGLAGAFVLRPLPPSVARLRVADYGVPNEIAMNLIRLRASTGDAAGALRLVERQLALEPQDLRDADPRTGSTRLSRVSAKVAGSFAPLHAAAAELLEHGGRVDEARNERRRAEILSAIAAQLARATAGQRGGAP